MFRNLNATIQKFADALDSFDKDHAFQHRDRDFIWEYLGCPEGNAGRDVRSNMLNLEHWELSTPSRMESAIHVLLRYKLLDILSGVLGIDTHPGKQTVSQVSMPHLPARVHKVGF